MGESRVVDDRATDRTREFSLQGGGHKVKDETQRSGPRVLTVRLSGRFVPFAASTVVFALLPFLGGSSSDSSASVVLAAGDRAAVAGAVDGVAAAHDSLTSPGSALSAIAAAALDGSGLGSTGMGVANALGGGFLFPALALTPMASFTAQATTAVSGMPMFIHPVPGFETSGFGPRIHPLLGRPMFHTGIDLSATCGTPIRAAAAGKVVYASVSSSWGLRTIIQHTPTVMTAYGHQSRFLVKQGDYVKQGQIIGLVGTTGWSTGCHLHFDVIVNNRYVDPAPYLGFPASAAASVPYRAVPHVVVDSAGRVVRTVEDGDVPLSEATTSSSPTGTYTPGTSAPTSSTSSPTSSTSSPSTTSSSPSTTTTSPSTTTSQPTTTTSQPSTTTSASSPTSSTSTPATSTPSPTPTAEPSTTSTPTSEPSPTTSDTTSGTSSGSLSSGDTSSGTTSSDPSTSSSSTGTTTP